MDNNKKVLTISIAAYNVEKYIEHTLESLIVPDIINKLEIFIIDDGSKDGTLEIAKQYERKYPNVFHAVHKSNGGYGSTVNYSLTHATGKYFKLLDGDDWFAKESMSQFIYYLENQTADIVLSPYYQVYTDQDNKKINIDDGRMITGTQKLENTPIEKILPMHEICVKTKLLQKQKERITEHCFYTDYEYVFLSLLNATTISHFELPVYCYQLGIEGQSVSIEGIRKHYLDKSKVSKQMYKWYNELYSDRFKGNHKKLLEKELLGITDDTYTAFMSLEDAKKGKKELYEFDDSIRRNFPEIYRITMSVKKIKLLRKTRFFSFFYLRKLYLNTFK